MTSFVKSVTFDCHEGVVGTVITVVRVGRAVFYIDRRDQYADGVPTDEQTIAEFIPTLAQAFG